MYRFYHFPAFYLQNNNSPSIFEIVTFLVTITAVGIAIWQSKLARESLDVAKKTIEDDVKARQISMLPEMYRVILVQTGINQWIKKIEEMKNKTAIAVKDKNEDLIKSISESCPKTAKDVRANSYIDEKTPKALKQILLSGAQYYYDAVAPAKHLWREDKQADWAYASAIVERYDDSLSALKKLNNLLADMVPRVILNTPASINDRDFLE